VNRFLTTVPLALLLAAPACAQEPAAAAKPETLEQRASYAIGLNFAQNLKSQQVPVDAELLVRGLRDGLAGTTPALSAEELQSTMQAFQQQMTAKQQASRQEAATANAAKAEQFLAGNRSQPGVETTASGLQYQVLSEGDGPTPKATDRVKVHYRGTLLDGTQFDSSHDRGAPAVFGVSQVIPGWIEALQLMKVGSKWKLFVPPALAYKERGAGNVIGPNEVLVFEVELLGIEEPQG
jgi:FKBP-type peptidyl-prolyl cis-trans isomerase FklB